jgi:hypothetical protein
MAEIFLAAAGLAAAAFAPIAISSACTGRRRPDPDPASGMKPNFSISRARRVMLASRPSSYDDGRAQHRPGHAELGARIDQALFGLGPLPYAVALGFEFGIHLGHLHGNPFDGHTLGRVITDMAKLTGVQARRIHVDKGCRGHNHPHRFRGWISGQVRRVTASIRREMKRRAAVEPVIGHVKAAHRMDRNYLKGPAGDRLNAVLAAAGYNFGLHLRWLAELLRAIIQALVKTVPAQKIAWAQCHAGSSRTTLDAA